jgi:TPP-dependent pyruvate/acetoin dehydrogenase alpha subunit
MVSNRRINQETKPRNRPSINGISRATSLGIYRSMLRIRRTQEALVQEYHPAYEMRCPVHFCIGQEAPPAGICPNLRPDDYVFTGHRSHCYYMAKGGSLQGLFAELYGKATGSNHGKAGHHELSDESVNFYRGAIVAGTIPIAAGTALAAQMEGTDQVSLCENCNVWDEPQDSEFISSDYATEIELKL